MNGLIDKVESLKEAITELDTVKKIKKLNEEIIQDKELIKLVEEYNGTNSEIIKKQIMSNELFQKYKVLETDLNVIILEINSKLKQINDKGKCC